MTSSLLNLNINLAEGIQKIKCKCGNSNRKCKTCGRKYKDCKCCLEYANVIDDLIQYKYLCSNKNYEKRFDDFPIHTKFLTML